MPGLCRCLGSRSTRCTDGRVSSTEPTLRGSSSRTLRDPDNFGKQWREIRDSLGLPDVSSHSFCKTVATLIDDSGLSARVGADQLGHARPSMTQDIYMSRGQVHAEVAAASTVELPEEKWSDDGMADLSGCVGSLPSMAKPPVASAVARQLQDGGMIERLPSSTRQHLYRVTLGTFPAC